jgi:hypothetical protein
LAIGQVAGATYWLINSSIGTRAYLVLLIVAMVTSVMVCAIFDAYKSVVWFSVAAFFALGAFIGLLAYDRTAHTLKVEPAAVGLTGTAGVSPFTGYYVADSGDNLYLATTSRGGHLQKVAKTQVTAFGLGPLLPTSKAPQRAAEIGLALCRRVSEKASTLKTSGSRHARGVKTVATVTCLPKQIAALGQQAHPKRTTRRP